MAVIFKMYSVVERMEVFKVLVKKQFKTVKFCLVYSNNSKIEKYVYIRFCR